MSNIQGRLDEACGAGWVPLIVGFTPDRTATLQ
jgi:hypothetical protein